MGVIHTTLRVSKLISNKESTAFDETIQKPNLFL